MLLDIHILITNARSINIICQLSQFI